MSSEIGKTYFMTINRFLVQMIQIHSSILKKEENVLSELKNRQLRSYEPNLKLTVVIK